MDPVASPCPGGTRRTRGLGCERCRHARRFPRPQGAGSQRWQAAFRGHRRRCGPTTLGACTRRRHPWGTRSRVHAVVLAEDRRHLPSGASAAIVVAEGESRLTGAGAEEGPVCFTPDSLTPDDAEMLARSLAPLREAGSTRTRDAHARLLDLAGAGAPASLAVERLWYGPRSTEALEVPIGVSDSGEVVTLALRRDGPHGLIAGTTGAGKSELLQSILAGLAVHNPPDVVSFLLVDYKGGAAFGDLATLPHTVGLVTDLDERLAARALVSLNAELRRREHILRQAGVADIAQFERQCRARAGGPTPQPLPNLVIVVDEFATIAQELPGFVDTLIDVAQRGRSLGVHLLLATQSPGGVVGPRLQANINYWMCLRVSLDAEATAMIGTNDAALIPVTGAGRAYLKVGSHLGAFQTARIACPVVSAGRGIVITPFADDRPPASGGPVLPQGHVADEVAGVPVETDLKVAVRRIAAEAIRLGVGRPPARGSRHCLRCCPAGGRRRPAGRHRSPR